jgi:hypothetical protein
MSQHYSPGTFPEIDGKKVIDIVATGDTICPFVLYYALIGLWAYSKLRFCYLGYTKVSQAVSQAEDQNLPLKISIRFAPFQVPVYIFAFLIQALFVESTT